MKWPLFISVALAAFVAPTHAVRAEPYAGIELGAAFGQRLTGLSGAENTNYPDPPDLSPDASFPFFPNTNISDIDLRHSIALGLKLGYYFDAAPELGVELEADYEHPNFGRQNVTLSNPAFAAFAGQNHFTEDQLPAQIRRYAVSIDGMYRYRGFRAYTPYLGAGPTLNIFTIRGVGYSGIVVDPPGACSIGGFCPGPGPEIKETDTALGVNLKAGVDYALARGWQLGVEYRYDWASVKVEHFRSISGAKGDFQAQSVGVVLVRNF
jgi:opacity protein-like surface antigen